MSDIKNFSWTDELLREFFYSAHKFFAKGHGFSSALTEFKKSKEKDIPKDNWEVISYIGWHNLKKDTIFKKRGNLFYPDGIDDHAGYHEFYLKEYLTDIKIHSVKRLSDGEVFTIGDEVKYNGAKCAYGSFKIQNFHLATANILARSSMEQSAICEFISDLEKVKPKVPLFTTEDGVDVFDKNIKLWIVFKNFEYKNGYVGVDLAHTQRLHFLYKPENNKYFYTEEKAKEYILLNKPVQVSYKELKDYVEKNCSESNCNIRTYKTKWEVVFDLFKEKINP